ncbi:hypothetical protein BSKO_08911 [Bryopsis sp. KO-2023]|nr:hypothetical protein BSKO_08911 [Bryopsis sp. KO-2023]
MALRQLAARYGGLRGSPTELCGMVCNHSSAVYDHLVEITVLDLEGVRHPIRGLKGQSLSDLLLEHPELSEGVVAPTPSGKGALDAHVLVAQEYLKKMPEKSFVENEDLIELADDHIASNSRLASAVKLSPEMQGLTVAMGKIGFFNTP